MERQKLYCPITGEYPVKLSDYWTYNGELEEKNIINFELPIWGWEGPFYEPIANIDYDPETHKVVWYSRERKYIILPKNEDSSQYEVLWRGKRMGKFYCPPHGGHPQKLPDYWRFSTGTIRKDLNTLSDEELHAWGWEGPFYEPIAKHTINNEEIISRGIPFVMYECDYTFDANSNLWTTLNHDYDPETHKVVWYSRERKYIILPKNEDSSQYEVLVPSLASIPDSKHFDNVVRQRSLTNNENIAPIFWDRFKESILTSPDFNQYIASILTSLPIIATSLPTAIASLEYGEYNNFKVVWSAMKNSAPPSVELIESLVALANNCNIPKDFVSILRS